MNIQFACILKLVVTNTKQIFYQKNRNDKSFVGLYFFLIYARDVSSFAHFRRPALRFFPPFCCKPRAFVANSTSCPTTQPKLTCIFLFVKYRYASCPTAKIIFAYDAHISVRLEAVFMFLSSLDQCKYL